MPKEIVINNPPPPPPKGMNLETEVTTTETIEPSAEEVTEA